MQISLAGIASALSIVLLFLGSAIWLLSYVMPIITGLLMIIITQCLNKKTAFTVYFCVSVLSLFLLSDKECVLIYVFFFGYYPIVKDSIEKINNNFLRWVLKFAIFNVSIVLSQLICVYVFQIPFDDFLGKWGIAVLLLLANCVFVLYEKMLKALIVLYDKKYKKKIDKLLNK